MKTLNIVAQILVAIGAINWGLVAWFDFNLVSAIFGVDTFLTDLVYTLVGLAGFYALYLISHLARTPAVHDHRNANLRNTDRDAAVAQDGTPHTRR